MSGDRRRAPVDASRRRPSAGGWAGWAAAALAAALWHAAIDRHIGLAGPTSDSMSVHQGASAALAAVLVGWWLFVTARAAGGDAQAVRSLLVLVAVVAVLQHGLAGLLAATPPSAAFPYQDLAHGASLGFGLVAFSRVRAGLGVGEWGRLGWATMVLLVAEGAVTGTLQASQVF